MVKNIIKFSLENKLLIIIASVLISIAGVYTIREMDTDVFPDLTAPTVVVMTEAHGMAPEEVERLVSFPLETAVNGATGIRRVRSSSAQGYSIVWVEFDWSMNVYNARQIVSEKIQTITGQLPEGVGTPTLMPQSSIMGEIFVMALTADSTSMIDLRTEAEWVLRPRLLSVNGVAQVTIFSEHFKQYQILPDPKKMEYYKVSLGTLVDNVSGGFKNVPGGYLEQYGNRYIIRGLGRTSDIDKMSSRVLQLNSGLPVKLGDVAEVKISTAPIIGSGSYNLKDAAVVLITKQPNVNTLELTEKIKQTLKDIKPNMPSDVKFHQNIFKQEDFIIRSVNNVSDALLEGGILVTIVLFLFLMNFRVTIISLVSIPISLLISILCLKMMGIGINTMVLGGMAIAIGSLVDDAIVDVENVYKRLRQNAALPKDQQLGKVKVIYNASVEIRSSIVNATLIIIAAFIPLFFLSGMEGRMLRPLGITYIISLFASLLIAMTLTNVLEVYLLTNDKKLKKHSKGSLLERVLTKWYEKALNWILKYKITVLATVVILFAGSFAIVGTFGRSFLPTFNEGTLTITAATLPEVSYEESVNTGRKMERTLLEVPEISIVERRTGRAELAEHSAGLNSSEIDVPYTLKDRSRDEFLEDVRSRLSQVPGISFEVGQPLSHRINHMLSGTKAAIAVKIFGKDLKEMYRIGQEIKSKVEGVDGLVDLFLEQQVDIPQIKITPKDQIMSAYGITMKDFLEFVDVGFAGEKIGTIFEGERSFPLVVRFDENERNSIKALGDALIDTPDGHKIPFSYIANITSASGPNQVNRENVKRKLVLSANVAGRDVRGVVQDIQNIVDNEIELPESTYVEYGGQFKSEESASKTLMLASFLSLLLIFVLLFQEFKSVNTTGIVMLNLPLALIGGVFAIMVTSGELNIPAIIGFITLFGIATRNGILLVSRYNTLIEEGIPYQKAIIKGSADRLIPILMTALTAALALIPMALRSDQPGNEIQSPMAIVILGGLLSSTVLNVFVLPIVFWYKERRADAAKVV
jgi:CzcA family heavy metal efflux pump